MRRLFYPLVAVLCFYASNCYALTPEEIKEAQNTYASFSVYYDQLHSRLSQELKAATAAKKKGENYDYTSFKSRGKLVDQAKELYYTKIKTIHLKDKNDATVKKLYEKAKSKMEELYKLKRKIEETM